MALPELLQKQAEKLLGDFCRQKVPTWLKEELRLVLVIEESSATLYQERRCCQGANEWFRAPLAQFRYIEALNQWSLHYFDHQERWQLYLNVNPSLDLSRLLKAVDEDPLGYFWG